MTVMPAPPSAVMIAGRVSAEGYVIDVISHGKTHAVIAPWERFPEHATPTQVIADIIFRVHAHIRSMDRFKESPIAILHQCVEMECDKWHAFNIEERGVKLPKIDGSTALEGVQLAFKEYN